MAVNFDTKIVSGFIRKRTIIPTYYSSPVIFSGRHSDVYRNLFVIYQEMLIFQVTDSMTIKQMKVKLLHKN